MKTHRASQGGPGEWAPLVCAICGERVKANSGLFMRNLGGEPVSLHHGICAAEWFAARKAAA